ncbi:MAG: MFS transporter [Saprospiraceae bacterium]
MQSKIQLSANNEILAPTSIFKVIFSSSLGTLIEWYDFYIFGFLAKIFSDHFFPKEMGTSAAYISTLAIFAAGFLVRPFGALFFGRIGDIIGRKYTFLLTLILMGGSTFLIGLVPGYKTLGMAAPILVLILRLIQGLALGGEYGGAATYVAEHSDPERRGFFTSWIQTTATLGLFLALGVILLVKHSMPEADYISEWGGWRYPFWISIVLVGVSIYIRTRMSESPLFAKIKEEGKTSLNPLKESFSHKTNFKMVLLALFGAVMGQGVIWYTSQFYAQAFLETKANLSFDQSRLIIVWAVLFGTPFFVFFGWLSDKIGRKWIMLAGMLLGILFYRPIFKTFLADTDIKVWKTENPTAAPSTSTAVNPIVANELVKENGNTLVKSDTKYILADGRTYNERRVDTLFADPGKAMGMDAKPKYENKNLASGTYWKFIFLVFFMVIFVTMVYGPIAAFLVEMFPTKIRYTSMSLPYHVGNGVFGGLVPVVATMITDTVKDTTALDGLYYPIGVASVCFIIGLLFLSNKRDDDVMDEENIYIHE